jgi:hypothetical protein
MDIQGAARDLTSRNMTRECRVGHSRNVVHLVPHHFYLGSLVWTALLSHNDFLGSFWQKTYLRFDFAVRIAAVTVAIYRNLCHIVVVQ